MDVIGDEMRETEQGYGWKDRLRMRRDFFVYDWHVFWNMKIWSKIARRLPDRLTYWAYIHACAKTGLAYEDMTYENVADYWAKRCNDPLIAKDDLDDV